MHGNGKTMKKNVDIGEHGGRLDWNGHCMPSALSDCKEIAVKRELYELERTRVQMQDRERSLLKYGKMTDPAAPVTMAFFPWRR